MFDLHQVGWVAPRLMAALIAGALVGLQRELTHRPAGLRTHMLVALGASLVVVTVIECGFSTSDISRVVQGVVTGIGFLGGGAILKLTPSTRYMVSRAPPPSG